MALKLSRGDGTTVTPGRLLGTGGEAFVHEIQEDSKIAAKVYRQPNTECEQKVLAMISRPPGSFLYPPRVVESCGHSRHSTVLAAVHFLAS